MKTLKELKKEAKSIVIALNSTGPNWDKYPWGNIELKNKTLELESKGIINYSKLYGTWSVKK